MLWLSSPQGIDVRGFLVFTENSVFLNGFLLNTPKSRVITASVIQM